MQHIGVSTFYRTMYLFVSCLLFLFNEVCGELCPDTDNVYCDEYNEYCCGTECCLMDYHYDYGFWNIWYFWFIIFFLLMSCCGGCGFYRRRQVVLRQHQADDLASGPPPGAILHRGRTTGSYLHHGRTTYSATTMGHTIVAHPMMYPQAPPPESYFSGPPSYNEVTSKPDMYPKAYPDSHANGAAVPYPTNDPAYPPPGPTMPYQMNNTAHAAIPPHTGAPPHTDNGSIAPPPPYTPTATSDGVPVSNSSNAEQAAS